MNEQEQEVLEVLEPEETVQEEPPVEEKTAVVDVHFRNSTKIYFFNPRNLELKTGDHVIIDTARGSEFGICASGVHEVPTKSLVAPLRVVLRHTTSQDEATARENEAKEKKAMEICQTKIAEFKLDMQLVSAEYAFDGSTILFFFTADGRVDFRELVKCLASTFRARIELRQIGVRDKAKMVGGLGVCGRPFCCSQFLDDFQPVSIKMAKTQNLSLNPTKISGTCGRLMCCLKYEQEAYEDLLKTTPRSDSLVETAEGRGTICDVNILRQSVRVRMEDHPETINTFKNDEIVVLRSGKARKTDAPIPRDVAPLSSKPKAPKPEPKKEDWMPPVQVSGELEKTQEPKRQNNNRRRPRPEGQKSEGERPRQPQKPRPPKQDQKPRPPKQEQAPQADQEKPAQVGLDGEPKPKRNNYRRYRSRKPKAPGGKE